MKRTEGRTIFQTILCEQIFFIHIFIITFMSFHFFEKKDNVFYKNTIGGTTGIFFKVGFPYYF